MVHLELDGCFMKHWHPTMCFIPFPSCWLLEVPLPSYVHTSPHIMTKLTTTPSTKLEIPTGASANCAGLGDVFKVAACKISSKFFPCYDIMKFIKRMKCKLGIKWPVHVSFYVLVCKYVILICISKIPICIVFCTQHVFRKCLLSVLNIASIMYEKAWMVKSRKNQISGASNGRLKPNPPNLLESHHLK